MQALQTEQASDSLQNLIAAEIASNDFQLPIFNEVALKLQNAIGDKDITIDDIEELIMEDPALAGQILRMVNSAFYKGLGKINTVKRAILRLGSDQVANMASWHRKNRPTLVSCLVNSLNYAVDRRNNLIG